MRLSKVVVAPLTRARFAFCIRNWPTWHGAHGDTVTVWGFWSAMVYKLRKIIRSIDPSRWVGIKNGSGHPKRFTGRWEIEKIFSQGKLYFFSMNLQPSCSQPQSGTHSWIPIISTTPPWLCVLTIGITSAHSLTTLATGRLSHYSTSLPSSQTFYSPTLTNNSHTNAHFLISFECTLTQTHSCSSYSNIFLHTLYYAFVQQRTHLSGGVSSLYVFQFRDLFQIQR